jgi:hypothetical protein
VYVSVSSIKIPLELLSVYSSSVTSVEHEANRMANFFMTQLYNVTNALDVAQPCHGFYYFCNT